MSMRNNEVIRGSIAVINNGQYLLSERKINVARMAAVNALEFGQSSVDLDIVGKLIDILAGGDMKLSATGNMNALATAGINLNASGGISATAGTDIDLNASGNGASIYLNGDKVRFKAASYGTGAPPTSSPKAGQVYFKLIS